MWTRSVFKLLFTLALLFSFATSHAQETLISAVRSKDSAALERLLSAGADPNGTNRFGDTALIWAVQQDFEDGIRQLLAAGADPNRGGSYGRTGLHWAARGNHVTATALLLDAGADDEALDERLRSPLWAAAAKGSLAVVALLLAEGAAVDCADQSGATPLLAALENGHAAVAVALLLQGADVDQPASNGQTPLDLALKGNLLQPFFDDQVLALRPQLRSKVNARAKVVSNVSRRMDLDRKAVAALVHDMVNRARLQNGLMALQYDPQLGAVAHSHARDMAHQNYYLHRNLQGEMPTQRALRLGYPVRQGLKQGIGENIAFSTAYHSVSVVFDTGVKQVEYDWYDALMLARRMFDGWMASPGHRANILNPDYRKHGFSLAEGDFFTVYCVQNFW